MLLVEKQTQFCDTRTQIFTPKYSPGFCVLSSPGFNETLLSLSVTCWCHVVTYLTGCVTAADNVSGRMSLGLVRNKNWRFIEAMEEIEVKDDDRGIILYFTVWWTSLMIIYIYRISKNVCTHVDGVTVDT